MREVKIGVLIILYNHEKYITDCLESVARQKTENKFSVDVIIFDDCSTDSSLELIEEFSKRNQHINTKVVKSPARMGVLNNALKLFDVKGYDYFAMLDGDDFWNSDEKLIQQIRFLENNQDYVGTCHDAVIQHQDEDARKILFSDAKTYSQVYAYKSELHPWDILSRIIIPTSSIVFRSASLNNVDKKYLTDAYSIGWKMSLFVIKNSKFYYFNHPWSTYRNHSKGISKSNVGGFHQSHIHFLKALLKDSYYKYNKYWIYKAISYEYFTLIPMLKKISKSGKVPLKYNTDFLLSELKAVYYSLKLINK